MNHRDQIDALAADLENMIERYREEFDLPLGSVIGILEIQKHALIARALDGPEMIEHPDDQLFGEVRAFKRRLDQMAIVRDSPHERLPPQGTTVRETSFPLTPFPLTERGEQPDDELGSGTPFPPNPPPPAPACPVGGTMHVTFDSISPPYAAFNGAYLCAWDSGTGHFEFSDGTNFVTAICSGARLWTVQASSIPGYSYLNLTPVPEGASAPNTQFGFDGNATVTP